MSEPCTCLRGYANKHCALHGAGGKPMPVSLSTEALNLDFDSLARKLEKDLEPYELDEEEKRVLYENLWDLYI